MKTLTWIAAVAAVAAVAAFPLPGSGQTPAEKATQAQAGDADALLVLIDRKTFGEKAFVSGNRPSGVTVDWIVVHSISAVRDLPLAEAFEPEAIFALLQRAKLSAHFLIDRDGNVFRMVATDRAAYHAGRFNGRSIGIELAGLADDPWIRGEVDETSPAWRFTDSQYASLNKLIRALQQQHPDLKKAIRHRDILEPQVRVVSPRGANVRSKPGESGEVLKTLKSGATVFRHRSVSIDDAGRAWTWCEVEFEYGERGWIRQDLVEDAGWGQRKWDPGEAFDRGRVAAVDWIVSHGAD